MCPYNKKKLRIKKRKIFHITIFSSEEGGVGFTFKLVF